MKKEPRIDMNFVGKTSEELSSIIYDSLLEEVTDKREGAVVKLMFATAVANDITLRQAMSRYEVVCLLSDNTGFNGDIKYPRFVFEETMKVQKRKKPIRISEQKYMDCKISALEWLEKILRQDAEEEKADR